ncbi:MAG: hypothetical protein LBH21_08480, partial [Gracilibacteraceae bacterium]|nr:hypothetical protein [Gracilibacteraceae bacterium]
MNSIRSRYGLTGEKLAHSFSPFLHHSLRQALACYENRAADDFSYELFEMSREEAGRGRAALDKLGLAGLNVTIPYKETFFPVLDVIAPSAAAVGAVNALALRAGRWHGYNTDYDGFGFMLAAAGIPVPARAV